MTTVEVNKIKKQIRRLQSQKRKAEAIGQYSKVVKLSSRISKLFLLLTLNNQ